MPASPAQLVAEFDNHGVALICASQGIESSYDNQAGWLQMNILAFVAISNDPLSAGAR